MDTQIVPTSRIDVEELIQAGIIIVSNALDQKALEQERRRQAAMVDRLQALHSSHRDRALATQSMISVQEEHMEVRIDGTSLVLPGSAINERLCVATFGILQHVRDDLRAAGFTGISENKHEDVTSAFVNIYICDYDGALLDTHVDHSFLTALTAAVDLQIPGSGVLPGFQYRCHETGQFKPAVPEHTNDLILMFGRNAASARRNGLSLRGVEHRVLDIAQVSQRNRSTMVFKLH